MDNHYSDQSNSHNTYRVNRRVKQRSARDNRTNLQLYIQCPIYTQNEIMASHLRPCNRALPKVQTVQCGMQKGECVNQASERIHYWILVLQSIIHVNVQVHAD